MSDIVFKTREEIELWDKAVLALVAGAAACERDVSGGISSWACSHADGLLLRRRKRFGNGSDMAEHDIVGST